MYEWIFKIQDSDRQEAKKSPSSSQTKSDLVSLAGRVRNNHKQLRESLERLQSSLDDLRLVNKYRIFDLEATRRENAYLKKLLEVDEYKAS